MPIEDFRFHHSLRVRWAEADAQAIVYYPVYLTWVEVALSEYCRHLGFRQYRLAELNLFDTVTARATIEYKAPARLDDLVDVYVRAAHVGNTSITFAYEVYRQDETVLLAQAEVVYVSYDNKAKRPRRVPQEMREVFGAYETREERLDLSQFPLFSEALV
ncbi:MAG: acyl-CoA thioesterase [Chloroflexi bacterium]|nr:acyl-CoA thioesterase [Chloroflexota bacterium]